MVYIFVALYCEAKPVIDRLGLTVECDHPFCTYTDPEGEVRLILTGMGKMNSAMAVSYVCGRFDAGNDILVNIGTCAGGKNRNGAFLINKVTDKETGKSYYPDMIYNIGLPESEVTTLNVIASEELTSGDDDMLWEMEASGFIRSALHFASPHCIQLIKVVSDNGAEEGSQITDKMLTSVIADNMEKIIKAIEVLAAVTAVEAHPVIDVSAVESEFKCSETMRQDLIKLLTYCRNSRRDHEVILDKMREEGLIPAPDRKAGKEALNDFRRRILQ